MFLNLKTSLVLNLLKVMFSDFLNHPSGSKSVQGGREMMYVIIVRRISMECTAPALGHRTTRILQNILHMCQKEAINKKFWQNALSKIVF